MCVLVTGTDVRASLVVQQMCVHVTGTKVLILGKRQKPKENVCLEQELNSRLCGEVAKPLRRVGGV
jgi:hypothetical protein